MDCISEFNDLFLSIIDVVLFVDVSFIVLLITGTISGTSPLFVVLIDKIFDISIVAF